MQFQEFHTLFFAAKRGAYSLVTDRENYDSQITLTDLEAEIVLDYFGRDNIHVGNVGSNRNKASKAFHLYGTDETINLNLVFPKPNKSELRLYISVKAGYKPESGNVWFLFVSEGDRLFIGELEKSKWDQIGQIDTDDDEYSQIVAEIHSESDQHITLPPPSIIEQEIGPSIRYVRNPLFALKRFELASYSCEIDPNHRTFISARTGKPFVEAHHFVPMKFQGIYHNLPLDNLDNIISLCPTCHRAFHHAIAEEKKELIHQMYKNRLEIHQDFPIEKILSLYNLAAIGQ